MPILGEDADPPAPALTEVQQHLCRIKRAHFHITQDAAPELAHEPSHSRTIWVFRGVHGSRHISVNVQGTKFLYAVLDFFRGEHAP
jgi:hypothetical protein